MHAQENLGQSGNNTVWLDCAYNYTHSETWLELRMPDAEKATELQYLFPNLFLMWMLFEQFLR
jgi:hypothetical protein